MIRLVIAGALGALFGLGLVIAGMTQPAKVLAFLDVTRAWDPSLAFVMVGAIGVYATLFVFARKRQRPWLDSRFHLPTVRDIDARLVIGAALFGVGWGLAGLCPGPAIVAVPSGAIETLLFVAAMTLGFQLVPRSREP